MIKNKKVYKGEKIQEVCTTYAINFRFVKNSVFKVLYLIRNICCVAFKFLCLPFKRVREALADKKRPIKKNWHLPKKIEVYD